MRGLARELSPTFEERVVRVSRLMALAPAHMFALTLTGVSPLEGPIAPPWPDVLISAGRRAGLAAMAIRRRSAAPMVTIHIQPPSVPAAFDLVVAMPHDRLAGRNVIQVDTALHGLSARVLAEAASRPDPRFAKMPRPWTAVLLGGDTTHKPFAAADALRLADGLDGLRNRTGGSLLVTPSRRTPAAVIAALGARFNQDVTTYFWDGGGSNPYLPMLACAEAVVVTGDSISMISEALATTADVWVFDVAGGGRHARFVQSLLDRKLIGYLGGPAPPRRQAGIDATPSVAGTARRLIQVKLQVQL